MSTTRYSGIFVVAIALAAGGSAVAATSQDRTLPASVGNLGDAKLVEVRDANGQALLTGTLVTSKNTPGKMERSADLTSPTGQNAKGEVEVEIERKDGVVTRDRVDLDLERLPVMATCTLFIDGQLVASFVTTKAGKAEFELSRKATAPRR
jgi:hypothetical protein